MRHVTAAVAALSTSPEGLRGIPVGRTGSRLQRVGLTNRSRQAYELKKLRGKELVQRDLQNAKIQALTPVSSVGSRFQGT